MVWQGWSLRCRTKGIGQGFSMALWLAAAATLFALPLSRAFYLPGVAPHEYKDGESVRQLHTKCRRGLAISPVRLRRGGLDPALSPRRSL